MKFVRTLLTALIAVIAIPSDATTIAIVWGPDQIAIASDELFENNHFQSDRGYRVTKFNDCKIQQNDSFFFAATGSVLRDDLSHLDMLATVRKYFVGSGDMKAKANRAAVEIAGPLLQAYQFAHKTQSAEQYKRLVVSKSAGGFVVATMSQSGPIIVMVQFLRRDDATGNPIEMFPQVTLFDAVMKEGEYKYQLLGINTAAARLAKTKGFFEKSFTTAARQLVQVEIDDRPDRVGPPIDVLAIDESGHHWVSPYGNCSSRSNAGKNQK